MGPSNRLLPLWHLVFSGLTERRPPTLSSCSDTNRLVPLAVVTAIVRHVAELEKSRLAVKADNVSRCR
jgi:hypothetical protein